MSKEQFQSRGLYFEQFNEGQIVLTRGRTITEADIVRFAGLSGDFNQIHTDAQFSANDSFGQRVAHGLLVQSIASGLAVQSGFIDGTVIAFRELRCKFSQPVFIGDTIHVKMEVTGKKLMKRLNGGNVYMKVSVMNQDDVIVQRGEWHVLMKCQPEEATEASMKAVDNNTK